MSKKLSKIEEKEIPVENVSKSSLDLMEYREQRNSIEAMIGKAIEKGIDPDNMQKFLDMRKQLKDEWAKSQFDMAMATAQGEFPEIKRTKSVPTRSGQIAYRYAPLEQIISQVKSTLSKYGLSYSIKTEMNKDEKGLTTGVKSTVIVRHIAGHSEESEMEVPLGNKTEIMSQSQVVAAAATFSKRYAFSNAFGIMTADEDSEGALKAESSQIEEVKNKIDGCSSMDELSVVWNGLTKEMRANDEVRKYTKEARLKIEQVIKTNENL